ncbi:hypothetical protein TWF970_008327 [Orbilia oligospora]|uniref:Uncharacterized protein n=1 Tax=Orbilia oligospora TaxID=2813651 RepID=A0A7C8R5W3_ORBOL|nr:hypothetical protein TWF970_008327 [Orbilia oligospora]
MKVFTVCYFSLLAFAPTALCQLGGKRGLDGKILPKFALQDVTTLTNHIKAEFDRTPKLIGAVDISGNVTFQLQRLNKYMEKTLFPAVNPQRFYPGTPGLLRARTCPERKAILREYENFFDAVISAREAAGAAVCRSTVKVPGAKENTAIIALTKAAIIEVDRTVNNIRRLWDNLYNKYNSIDFFIYHCKARNNPAGCRNPGEGCPPKPERCPIVCPCYYGFVDGKNSNKDQCFTNENEIMEVASVSGKSSRASFGWENLKDCRQCFLEDDPLPTCVNVL